MTTGAHKETRTSETHPLQIATLPVGIRGGAVGVTFAPGKHQAMAMTGIWARDLTADLMAIRAWGASHLVTLLEPHEFDKLKISALPSRAAECGLHWYGLPITDGNAPDARFLVPWRTLSPFFVKELFAGKRVVAHCKGGLGRAGTVACLLLMDSGTSASAIDAMARVRSMRPGAIETSEQEQFLLSWAQDKEP